MTEPHDIQDSTLLNFKASMYRMEQALKAPKKRGVKAAKQDINQVEEDFRSDMAAIITSPLAQLHFTDPVPELTAAQVESLRTLYAVLNSTTRTDEELKIALEAAVKQLNSSFEPKVEEPEETQEMEERKVTGKPTHFEYGFTS